MLRPARLLDLGTICELELEQFRDLSWPYVMLRQLFDLHGAHWVVADVDGQVRGYALVGLGAPQPGLGMPRHSWVLGLAVSSRYQGRGIASALLDRAIANCRAALADSIYITVRPENHAAAGIYKKAGFNRVAHEARYFGKDEPRDVLMRRISYSSRTVG